MVTEKGAKEIDAEWVLAMEAQSVLYTNRPGFEEKKIELANKFGGTPRDADVIWALLVKERLQHNSKKEWGLFRNSTYDMATLLKVGNRFRDALGYYLDVAYLDIFLEQQLLRELGQKGEVAGVGETSIAPAVIAKISEISLQLGLPTTEVEQYFFSRAETLKRANSKLPAPEFAWSIIKGAAL